MGLGALGFEALRLQKEASQPRGTRSLGQEPLNPKA